MNCLRDFIEEFRLKCCDTWGDALEAHFECVGQLYERGEDIPSEYEYKPGACATDPDSYWHDIFESADVEVLETVARFLFKYLTILEKAGLRY